MHNRVKVRQRGSVLVLFALTILPLCALAGFVIDLGWYYQTEQAATTAAEAAALATVRAAMDNIALGGYYVCGSKTTVCQSATPCPTANTYSNTAQIGCAYAATNGFSQGGLNGRQSVSIETNITSPPPTVSGVTVEYWATARVSQSNPLLFLSVLQLGSLGVTARSTAGVVALKPSNCLVSLDPTASPAVTVNGTSIFTLSGCGAQIDSNGANALNLNGGGCLNSSSINIVGGVSGTDSCSASAPHTGASSASDPLAAVPPPQFSPTPCATVPSMSNGGTATLSPGVYCGGLTLRGTVNFTAGNYVMLGGGLSCSSSCTMNGTGVTFYNTCSTGYCNGASTGYAPFNIKGTLNLSAPTSGDQVGMLFFGDRSLPLSAGDQEDIEAAAITNLTGAIYFPTSYLVFAGTPTFNGFSTMIVVNTMKVTGNSTVQITNGGSSTPGWKPSATLID